MGEALWRATDWSSRPYGLRGHLLGLVCIEVRLWNGVDLGKIVVGSDDGRRNLVLDLSHLPRAIRHRCHMCVVPDFVCRHHKSHVALCGCWQRSLGSDSRQQFNQRLSVSEGGIVTKCVFLVSIQRFEVSGCRGCRNDRCLADLGGGKGEER